MTSTEQNKINLIRAYAAMVREELDNHILQLDMTHLFTDVRDFGATMAGDGAACLHVLANKFVYIVGLRLYLDQWQEQQLTHPLVVVTIRRGTRINCIVHADEIVSGNQHYASIAFGQRDQVNPGYSNGMSLLEVDGPARIAQFVVREVYYNVARRGGVLYNADDNPLPQGQT